MMIFGYFFSLAFIVVHTLLKCVAGIFKLLTAILKGACRLLSQ